MYIRFGREDVPVVTDEHTPFRFGKGEVFAPGKDLTIIACGVMVYEALRAREQLLDLGIEARVVNLHTVKPLDRTLIEQCARETGAIVTARPRSPTSLARGGAPLRSSCRLRFL